MELLQRHLPRVYEALQSALNYLGTVTAQIFGAPPPSRQHERNAQRHVALGTAPPQPTHSSETPAPTNGQGADTHGTKINEHLTPLEDNTVLVPLSGLEERDPLSGLEERDPPSGLEERDPPSVLEERDPPSGLEERDPPSGLEERDPPSGLEEEDPQSGLEERDLPSGLEEKDLPSGLQERDPPSGSEEGDPSPDRDSEQTDAVHAGVTEERNIKMELRNRAKSGLENEAYDEGPIRDLCLPREEFSPYGKPMGMKYDHFKAKKIRKCVTFSEYDQHKEKKVEFFSNDKYQLGKATNKEELSEDPTPQKISNKRELNSGNVETSGLESISCNTYEGSSVDSECAVTAQRQGLSLEEDHQEVPSDAGLAEVDILSTTVPKDDLSILVTHSMIYTESPDTGTNKQDPSHDYIKKETKLTEGTFQNDPEEDIKEEPITSVWTSQSTPESNLAQKEMFEVGEHLHDEKTNLFTLEDLGAEESYEEASRFKIASSEDISLEVPVLSLSEETTVLSLVDMLGEDCTLETKGQFADEKGSGHLMAESGLERLETEQPRIDMGDHHANECQELNVGAFQMQAGHPMIYGEIKLEPIDGIIEGNSDYIPRSLQDDIREGLEESKQTIWYDKYESETEMEVGNDKDLQTPEDTSQLTTESMQETKEQNTDTLQKLNEQLQDEEQLIAFSANLIKDVLQGLCLAGQHQTSLLPAESSVGENDQLTHVIYNEKSDPSIEEAKELPVERESLSAVGPTEEEILVREAEKSLNQDEPNNVQEVECLNLRDQLQKTELNNDQTNDEESMELLQQELSLDQPRNVAQSEEANRFLTEICVKEQSLPQLEDEDLQAYPLNEEAFTSKEDLTSGKGEKDQILSGENAEYTEERCTAKLPNTTGSSETHQELHWIPKPQLLNTYVDLDFMNSGNEVAFSKEDRANITSDGEEHIQEETDFAASTGEPSEEIETLPKSVSPTQDEETCKISAEFIVISNDEESMELLQQKLSLDQPRNVAQSEEPNRFLTEIFVKEQSLPQLEDEDLQAYPLNEETFTPKEDLTSGKGEKDQILYKTQNEEGSAGEIYKHISHLATELHDSSLVEKFQSQTFEEDIHFQTMVDFYRDSKREESFEQIDHSNKVEQSWGTYDISTQDTFTSQIQSTFSGENAEYTEERCTAKLPNTKGSSETHQELHWIPKPQLLNTYVDLDFMNSGNEVAFSEEDRSNITSDRLGEEHIQEETDFTASTGEPSEEIETLPKSVSPTQDEETCKTSAEFIVISKENVGVLSHLSPARSPFSDEETERVGSDLVGVMHPLHKEINIIKPADDLRESMKVMGELSDVEPEITQTHSLDDANKLATLEESHIFTMTNQLQVGKEEQDGEKAAAFSKEPQTEISKMDILLKSIKEVQDKETLHTTHHLEETKHVVISDENVMELNISPMEDETESNMKDLEESLKEINMLLNVQTEMTVNHSEDVRETTGEGSQYFTIPGQSQQLVGEEDILQKEENHYITAHCTEPSEKLLFSSQCLVEGETKRVSNLLASENLTEGGIIEPEDNLRDISESENELDMLSNRVNEEPPTLEEVQSLSTSEQSLVGEEDILEEKSLPTDQPTEVNEREILTNSTQEDKTLNTNEAMESIEISNDHFIDPSKELHLNSISSQIEDETEDIIEHPPEEEKDIITPADNLTDFHGSQKELNLLSDVLPNIATNYPAEHCKETYVEQATLEEEPEGQSQPCVSEENISEETDKSTSEDQPTVIERDSEIQVEENLQPSDNLEETKTIVIPGEIFMDLSGELFLPVANSLVIDNEKERLYDQTEQTSQEERNVLKLDDNNSEKELYVVSDVHTNVTQSHTAEDVIAWKSHDWGEPIMEAIAMEQTHSFKGYIEDQDAPVEEGEVSVSDLLPKAEFILIPDVKPIELDNPDSLSRGGGSERATKDTLGIMSVSPLVGIVITTDHESPEDKNSSEMKCSSEEDAIDGNDVVHMSTNQKGEHLEAAILSVPEKSLVANPDLLSEDEVGGELKAKETLSDQEEGTLLPHNTLDLSAQKSRVILRRKTSIRKRPRQTLPDPETIEQPPPPVFRKLAMGVPVFPVKLPIIAPLHPKPTPPPAEVHKEEKPPTEGLAVQPKKVMPRHAGFGVPHPQMMQELQNRLLKKKPKQ